MEEIKKPYIDDLTPEEQEEYQYLMDLAKIEHPNTLQHILDICIRYYLKHRDNMLNVKTFSKKQLNEMKAKYNTKQEEIYNCIEIIRDADLTDEQRAKYDADRAEMVERIENKDIDALKDKINAIQVLENKVLED